MTKGATANFRPWTEAEKEIVRARYVSDGPAALAAELGRSESAIHHRARRLGTLRKRRWTAKDDADLRMLWGEKSVRAIARALGRTEATTYWRAQHMGLPLGPGPGQEYLYAAAVRTGYCTTQLRRILAWAGVRLVPTMSRPGASSTGRHFHAVDSFDLDEALERWHATETLEAAARRTGWCAETIARDLTALGDEVPPKPKDKTHWRIPSELVDRAIAHRLSGARRAA